MDVWTEVFGWFGAATLLAAYAFVSVGRLKQGRTYQAMNLLGAAGVALATWEKGSYPAATLNLVWMGIAVFVLAREWRSGREPVVSVEAGPPAPPDGVGRPAGRH